MTHDPDQEIIFLDDPVKKCGDLNMWLVNKSHKYTTGAGGYVKFFIMTSRSCPDNCNSRIQENDVVI